MALSVWAACGEAAVWSTGVSPRCFWCRATGTCTGSTTCSSRCRIRMTCLVSYPPRSCAAVRVVARAVPTRPQALAPESEPLARPRRRAPCTAAFVLILATSVQSHLCTEVACESQETRVSAGLPYADVPSESCGLHRVPWDWGVSPENDMSRQGSPLRWAHCARCGCTSSGGFKAPKTARL